MEVWKRCNVEAASVVNYSILQLLDFLARSVHHIVANLVVIACDENVVKGLAHRKSLSIVEEGQGRAR